MESKSKHRIETANMMQKREDKENLVRLQKRLNAEYDAARQAGRIVIIHPRTGKITPLLEFEAECAAKRQSRQEERPIREIGHAATATAPAILEAPSPEETTEGVPVG